MTTGNGASNVVHLRAPEDTILNKQQLAKHLGRSERWVEMKMAEGMPAKPVDRFGRRRYSLREVHDWLETPQEERLDRMAQLEARVAELERRLG